MRFIPIFLIFASASTVVQGTAIGTAIRGHNMQSLEKIIEENVFDIDDDDPMPQMQNICDEYMSIAHPHWQDTANHNVRVPLCYMVAHMALKPYDAQLVADKTQIESLLQHRRLDEISETFANKAVDFLHDYLRDPVDGKHQRLQSSIRAIEAVAV